MNRPSTVHHPVPYPAPRPLGGTGGARSALTAPRTVGSQAHAIAPVTLFLASGGTSVGATRSAASGTT